MCTGTIHTMTDPVAAILDFEGASAADYARLTQRWNPHRPHRRLQGCVYHWIRHYPEGFRVIEFWRGRALFERFLSEELLPLLSELALEPPLLTIESVPADAIDEADARHLRDEP